MVSGSSHILGGHGDKAHYSRGVLHGARALTSNGMLPHCGLGELSTQGMKQKRKILGYPVRTCDATERVPL